MTLCLFPRMGHKFAKQELVTGPLPRKNALFLAPCGPMGHRTQRFKVGMGEGEGSWCQNRHHSKSKKKPKLRFCRASKLTSRIGLNTLRARSLKIFFGLFLSYSFFSPSLSPQNISELKSFQGNGGSTIFSTLLDWKRSVPRLFELGMKGGRN